MSKKRKIHSANFKAKVALAALKGDKTSNQLTSQFGVTSGQISTWKKRLIDYSTTAFDKGSGRESDIESATSPLFEEIGRLKIELDWLKKKSEQWNA